MIELFRGALRISWGAREWELQAPTLGGYLHWSGPPYLTEREAIAALPAWKAYDFFTDAYAVNVRTGRTIKSAL